MIWPEDISFEGFSQKISECYENENNFIGDPSISAQYALDLIFKNIDR